jgi:DNA-binding LytR/AlgR family response regulator
VKEVKAVIADDEKELRGYLLKKLNKLWPELVICGQAENGPEALELIQMHGPDIAFLDIRMPGLSGLEVADKIAGMCRVVFITAYDQFALQAFEMEAVDYIVKPVTDERLTKTIRRLKKEIVNDSTPPSGLTEAVKNVLLKLDTQKNRDYLNWIKAQYGDEVRLIPVNEVYYFKASDKYTIVMTAAGESLIRKGIKELVDELNPARFWQIHRGTIVNVNRIEGVTRSFSGNHVIRLKEHPETLTVSRSYAHLFRQM